MTSRLAINLGLVAAGIMTLTAASAGAQSYSDDRDSYVANERVIVTAPPTYGRGSTTGAPIRDVAFSREVRIDDLDLHTRWGQRALYGRIHATARSLCRKLDMMYPVSADNNPDCYRTAVDNAMAQAYDMIGDNRD